MDRTDYLSHVMQNYQDLTETADFDTYNDTEYNATEYNATEYRAQYGGGENDKPTGGFPPIYIHDEATKNQDETLFVNNDKKRREYEKNKNAVSIKDIISKRRNLKPFISVSGRQNVQEIQAIQEIQAEVSLDNSSSLSNKSPN
jgi:hypothetical protein